MPMDLEVRHLRLVAALADHASLTRAGEHLHLTQSALSHQLRSLEDRLGAALFLREHRRMVPTAAGERLLETARAVLAQLDATERAIRDGVAGRRVLLRITTECYTAYHWLPPLLGELHRTFPEVEVRIDVDATARPVAALLEGKLDLAIVSAPVRDRRVVSTLLFQDELLVALSPRHRLAGEEYIRPGDLRDETVLVYTSKEESLVFQRVLVPAGVAPAAVQRVPLTEAMIELVKAGLGVAVLARWALQPHIDRGAIRGLPLTARGLAREWHAVMSRSIASAPHTVEFLRLLSAVAAPADRRHIVEFRRPVRRR